MKQADSLPADRDILLKHTRHMNENADYVIEISTHEDYLYIAAFDVNTPESLLIVIKPDKKQFIIDQFE